MGGGGGSAQAMMGGMTYGMAMGGMHQAYPSYGMGGGPMGMLGQRGKSGGSRSSLNAPAPLEHDLSEDDEDDW